MIHPNFFTILALLLSPIASAQPSSIIHNGPAGQHNNYFYIYTNGISKMSCKAGTPVVSAGQPNGGASASFKGNTLTVLVKAGRQNTQGPAQAFMSGLTPNNVIGDNTSSAQPSDLNFSVALDCQITTSDGVMYTLDGLNVGQGNENGNNNWWIGQADCERNGSDLVCGDFVFGTGSVDKMTLTAN